MQTIFTIGTQGRHDDDFLAVLKQHGIDAVIDTSGSLDDEMLADISAELASMSRHFQVRVVECDAVVRRVYDCRPITDVQGRGGTDLRPPFEKDFLRRERSDIVVYFTDGLGPAPRNPPAIPVIWCLTPGGQKPSRWGGEIRMDDTIKD
ncbi:MAG: hypothetical protein FJ224_07920 [Lentisphaerae bacterium]|nr:hypothetical protein [Lentisphaerota bacterium]